MKPTTHEREDEMSATERKMIGNWWEYMGYSCGDGGTFSYSCPALKLHGYQNPTSLESAVRREVAKRVKAAAKETK